MRKDALRLAAAAPVAFLGLGNRLGHLTPGHRADIVALDPAEIRVLATWVAGEEETATDTLAGRDDWRLRQFERSPW